MSPEFESQMGHQAQVGVLTQKRQEQVPALAMTGYAVIAQLVERIFCKDKVPSSNLSGGSSRQERSVEVRILMQWVEAVGWSPTLAARI